jgi:hypothetical protein
MPTLISIFEKVIGISAKYELIDSGVPYAIDVTRVLEVLPKLGINFDDDYIEKIIRKYYS